MGKTATRVLVFWLIAAASSVCFAQRNVLPTAPPPDKKPCDMLTKADAESILGQPAEWRQNNPFQCDYVETGWTNKPPKNKRVSLSVSTTASPDANAVADVWKNLADHPMPTRVSKNLPNFADAAIWNWYQGHGGELFAYNAGTISVSVLVTGLPEDAALEHAQAIAAKMLGGSVGTGYAYNAPKIMPRMDKPPVASADALPPEKAAPVASIQGGKTFAEAVPITASQFLQEMKEVSLTIVSAPTLAKWIPNKELERYVVDILKVYHISVRPDAPVALQVTIDELLTDIRTTTTRYDSFASTMRSTTEDSHAHTFAVLLQFFVRTAVWRNGTFHAVIVAPVSSFYFNDFAEAGEVRKQLIGDETPAAIRANINELLTDSFKGFATGKTIDETPWPVSSWSDKEKAAANAAFAKVMSGSTPVEKRPTEGLDSAPKLDLSPQISDNCKSDPSWRDFWSAEFQRMGWVKPQPGLSLSHYYTCEEVYILGGYYHLVDRIGLYESNVVFELNGKFFRKKAELFSTHRMVTTMGDRLGEAQQGFIPRSIMQFTTDLTLGKRIVPAVIPTSNSH